MQAGFDYTPYGEIDLYEGYLNETSGTGPRFTGHILDTASQTYFAPFRNYAPGMGRWMTPDPLGMVDGPNVYGYVRGNPTDSIDELGFWGRKSWSKEKCAKTLRKIRNTMNEIHKRLAEYEEDKLCLPERTANDWARPSESRWGHRKMIMDHKRNLKKHKKDYFKHCTDDDGTPHHPIPLPVPIRVLKPKVYGPPATSLQMGCPASCSTAFVF